MKNELIILSGGMDSTTLLYQEQSNIQLALSFNYGQKHNKELIFARYHCNNLGIPHQIISLESITQFLKSNLLQNGRDIPDGHYEDFSMKQTVVPFRNGIMLAIAAGIAESQELDAILIGNHAGDHAIYPDCRQVFIQYMNDAIMSGTYREVKIKSPYVSISKREIALLGKLLHVDYTQTWSCYKGKEIHCGTCGTCTERKEALNGFDPTKYEV